ncbi:hypothetical protein LZ187_23625, partial [Rhodovulum sulfidophilum]|nr:hypothetical protein [Rhodovulum sulfidophilum]
MQAGLGANFWACFCLEGVLSSTHSRQIQLISMNSHVIRVPEGDGGRTDQGAHKETPKDQETVSYRQD